MQSVFCVLGCILLAACGGKAEPGGGQTDADTLSDSADGAVDTGTDVDVEPGDTGDDLDPDSDADTEQDSRPEPSTCLSTAGCNSFAPGTICIDGLCEPCGSDEACMQEETYGSTATCDEGLCVPCPFGTIGCECAAGDCEVGECVAGECVDCLRGDLDCACLDDASCNVGLRCGDEETCEECPPGEASCPCDLESECAGDLLCIENLCVPDPCVPGAVDCPCAEGEICDASAGCHADGFCRDCDADAVGCACDDETGCSDDYVCDSDTEECRHELSCAEAECRENQLCADADDPDGEDAECLAECADGFVWNSLDLVCEVYVAPSCTPAAPNSLYEACTAQARTCIDEGDGEVRCGDCLIGYRDDLGECQIVDTCAVVAPICALENRTCLEAGDHSDAECGGCSDLYIETGGVCVLGGLTCAEGDFSIASDCADELRVCVPGVFDPPGEGPRTDDIAVCGECIDGFATNPLMGDVCDELASCADRGCAGLGRHCFGEPFASCGDCLDGLTPDDPADDGSACHERVTCELLACASDEFCIESTTGGDARCASSECAEGEAFNRTRGACVECTVVCDPETEGATGRIWAHTREGSDDCICETEPGYFADSSRAALPQPCDADGDGWLRRSAQPFVEHPDETISANARCDLREIASITLRNEWQQELQLHICGAELVSDDELETSCAEITPAALYENDTLDDDSAIESLRGFFPRYADLGVGRSLYAAEVNPLTKGCISEGGDLNNNGVIDVSEVHGMAPPAGVVFEGSEFLWIQISYFVELHRGFYSPRPLEPGGTYVISERSRCEMEESGSAFPLGYSAGGGSEYWRSCSRSRATTYDAEALATGFDFAQYTCAAEAGGCPLPAPVVAAGELPPGGVQPHGLCDSIPLPPADGVWRGMNHASQFACVAIADFAVDTWDLEPEEVFDGLGGGQPFEFNRCRIACPEEDPDCSSDCLEGVCATSEGADSNPDRADVVCRTDSAPEAGDVGFTARRFLEPAPGDSWRYTSGCIDEWEVWPDLCPGWLPPEELGDAGSLATGDGLPNDFGRLVCGCGVNYGGADCDYGCPLAAVSGDFDVDQGWWICPELHASSFAGGDPAYGDAFVGVPSSAPTTSYVLFGDVPTAPAVRTPMCSTPDCTAGFVLR